MNIPLRKTLSYRSCDIEENESAGCNGLVNSNKNLMEENEKTFYFISD